MPDRIPQSATIRVPLQAYLSTDHITPATGKTIAITISKNGAAYGNPSGGATNATEIGSGSYYVDLSTTDTGTAGPLFVLGIVSGVDNIVTVYLVANAHNGGFDGIPNAAAEAAGGLYTRGSGAGQIAQSTNGQIDVDAKKINGVATTSVTTINANVGLTQPLNFTGAGASALAKSDMVDIAGSAVSTATAQIGVNAVNIAGQAAVLDANNLLKVDTEDWKGGVIPAPAVTGVPKIDLSYILGTLLTETAGQIAGAFKKWFNVASPTGTVNSIPDAVAGAANGLALVGSSMGTVSSVTGNVGGNVVGSVGSVAGNVGGNVVGSVGSVVGNVGGNVAGTVGSVVGNIGGNLVGNVNGNVVGTVGSVVGNVGGNVTGSVGSVIGNIGGNVAGSVGSVAGNVTGNVVGSVGSVAGNVSGNVVGSVGSVVAAVTLSFAQALDESAVGATVGAALNAARVQGLGKWGIAADTLTLYASDNSTAVKAFTLAPSGGPYTSRS